MGVFDTVVIRIFSEQKEFNLDMQTHVTLLARSPIDYKYKVRVVEKLINIYKADNIGVGDIRISDLENLEEDKFWLGRRWVFNQFHGLWNSDNEEEKYTYEVNVNNSIEEGFRINILSYNQLVSLFASD